MKKPGGTRDGAKDMRRFVAPTAGKGLGSMSYTIWANSSPILPAPMIFVSPASSFSSGSSSCTSRST